MGAAKLTYGLHRTAGQPPDIEPSQEDMREGLRDDTACVSASSLCWASEFGGLHKECFILSPRLKSFSQRVTCTTRLQRANGIAYGALLSRLILTGEMLAYCVPGSATWL